MKATKVEQADAIAQLSKLLQPGDTVWTTLKHISQSGMYRVIDLYVIKDNEPLRLSYSAGVLCEGYDKRHEGARATSLGMDAGFALVYNLGYALYPSGVPCVANGCNSNDHRNGVERPEGTCFEGCANILHNNLTVNISDGRCGSPWMHGDGGYAFKHRWL